MNFRRPQRPDVTLADRVMELNALMAGDEDADVLLPPEEWRKLLEAAHDEARTAEKTKGFDLAATVAATQPLQCATNSCGWCAYCIQRAKSAYTEDFRRLRESKAELERELARWRQDAEKLANGAMPSAPAYVTGEGVRKVRTDEGYKTDSAPFGAAEAPKPKKPRKRRGELTHEESAELAAKYRAQREEMQPAEEPHQVDIEEAVAEAPPRRRMRIEDVPSEVA